MREHYPLHGRRVAETCTIASAQGDVERRPDPVVVEAPAGNGEVRNPVSVRILDRVRPGAGSEYPDIEPGRSEEDLGRCLNRNQCEQQGGRTPDVDGTASWCVSVCEKSLHDSRLPSGWLCTLGTMRRGSATPAPAFNQVVGSGSDL
jgi:hypothetical protein